MKKITLLKTLLMAVGLCMGGNAWAGAPVSGSDYLIKNVQTGYYLVGGIDWGTHACLHKMPQWFTFTGSDNDYTLDSHQFNNNANYHFLATGLYVDGATTNWTVTETATPGVFTISNDGNYIAGNGVDAAITTTTDGTAAAAQWQLISYSDFVSTLEGEIGVSGVDATPYIKDPELKRNGNFITYSGTKPWSITSYDGTVAPSNYSEGNGGNNASCAESFQSSNGFKFAQTLTGLKPGQYKLTAQAFYRQDGEDTDNYPYLFVGDAKSYFPVRSGGENSMVEAYASFLAGTYPVAPITFVVTSESDNVTIGYANANVKMWNIFGQTQLTYYGTALINDAKVFNNGGVMTAGQWYYFDATVAGTYEFSAGSDITAISYTTDGTQLTSSATGTTLTASPALSVTRYYFKSSSAQTLTVDVPTGAQIVNADIDFSNAISDGAVAGSLNSMALSNTSGSYIFEKGYNGSNTGVLRVGNGTGTVTIPAAQYAGTRDEVIITFDMYYGNLSGKNAGFYLYDNAGTPNVIGGLYISKYSNTEVINSFGVDRSKITAVGSSSENNDKIVAATNKSTFEIHLNYATGTMYLKQWTNGTLQQTTSNVAMGSTNPLKQFAVKSDYQNDGRRCWFDNLVITTIKGDYTVSSADYTVNWVCGVETVKTDTRTGDVGSDIDLYATDKNSFIVDAKKYLYVSDNADGKTVADDNSTVVTITVREAAQYNYTVNAVDGEANVLQQLASGSVYEDAAGITVNLPKYVLYSGTLYYQAANRTSETVESDNQVFTVEYAATGTTNVVYYSEAENVSGGDAFSNSVASNYQTGRYQSATTFTNVGLGKYQIVTLAHVGNGNAGDNYQNVTFYAGDTQVYQYMTKAKTNNQSITSTEFDIYEATDLKVHFSGSSSSGLDYIYVVRTGEAEVSATITDCGWTSFASQYALDLSSLEGATAYYASAATGSTVTLTSTDAIVPANTGLMIKGTVGESFTINVTSEDATNDSWAASNLLKPSTGESVAASTGDTYHYIFGYVTGDPSIYGFYNLTADTEVPAGKAYLETEEAGARLTIIFDDETTGISDASRLMDNGERKNDNFFNLNGQRIEKPAKGLYIVNGKKVVMK